MTATITVKTATVERCLGQCRYVSLSAMQAHRHKLQQAWEILTYRGGEVDSRSIEWRDVPEVQS